MVHTKRFSSSERTYSSGIFFPHFWYELCGPPLPRRLPMLILERSSKQYCTCSYASPCDCKSTTRKLGQKRPLCASLKTAKQSKWSKYFFHGLAWTYNPIILSIQN
ncbi:hypothetical protein T265_10745 [Opisthorchis viverrini]|uniref:Uncharacterized protein n=1 Tax=Opisthorchis viverrini TaxID=6198 RepID=A0A075A041_OPIVI|nr:hypothetical protein T265_10745 [Opisthorchis viverrini]KER20774.1 hypothetical protein T265_10745 [Opisthorchis viverrini]